MSLNKFRGVTKNALMSIVLVTNAFVWYYFVINFLQKIVKTMPADSVAPTLVWSFHFAGFAFSALAGSALANKVQNKRSFLIFWMALGTATSLASTLMDLTYIPNILILSPLLGISLGLGMPSCMGYFTETIQVQNRGRVGGITLLLSGVGMAVLKLAVGDNIFLQTIVLAALRITGLIFLLFLGSSISKSNLAKNRAPSFKSVINQRSFLLYLVPWTLFSLITYLTTPIQSGIVGRSMVDNLLVIENVLIGTFAIVGGFFADAVGRKRIAISGFVLLGLGYSVLGLSPDPLFGMYFYTVVDGVAWGMLFTVFVVTIWGDLSQHLPSEKYYAIGVLPFFISKYLQIILGTAMAEAIPGTAIFSFTAVFLFLAVLPLVYAPETLPEKTMRDRELKIYIEKAQKVRQKYA